MTTQQDSAPPTGGRWPQPRVLELQVADLYRHAPTATGFSYFGAVLALGVMIQTGDAGRGTAWFLWATIVAAMRVFVIVAYRRRVAGSDPTPWATLMIACNFLAGLQWAALGTLLWVDEPVYRQLFTLMVITCFVGGSLPAYASVRGAHEALSIPATIPTGIYLFFVQDGLHWIPGVTALFFCFAIVFYARKLNTDIEERLKLQVERDVLLELTDLLNDKLTRENQDLAHRAAMRSISVEAARERAGGWRRCSRTRRCPSSNAMPAAESSPATPPPSASSARTMSCSSGARSLRCCPGPTPSPRRSRACASPRTSRWSSRSREAARTARRASPRCPSAPAAPAGFGVILTGVTVSA
jgi:hypothetical protein